METSGTETRGKKRRVGAGCRFALILSLALAPEARGAFIGAYGPENFTLSNELADGFITSTAGGASILLTGGNDGSGIGGLTDLIIGAPETGLVGFLFSYSSLDSPGWDRAGYLLDNVFVPLADSDGQSGGPITFMVGKGQTFGWRVVTDDNGGEPGVLAISNFSAPASGVPEPGTLFMMCLGAAALGALRCRSRAGRMSEEAR